MPITREYLLASKIQFEKQRDEFIAQLNQVEGALRTVDFLLAKLEAEESPPVAPESE